MKPEKRGERAGRHASPGTRGCKGEAGRRVVMASLMGLVLLLATAAWGGAQTTTAQLPPAQHVLDVAVEESDKENRVVISADGIIEPNAFPHQGTKYPMVIVDIPGTTMLAKQRKIPVDSPLLQQVRIGQHTNPTKVRVVLDLLNDVAYDVVKLDLYLGDPEHPNETPTRLVVTLRPAPPPSP